MILPHKKIYLTGATILAISRRVLSDDTARFWACCRQPLWILIGSNFRVKAVLTPAQSLDLFDDRIRNGSYLQPFTEQVFSFAHWENAWSGAETEQGSRFLGLALV